MNTIVAAPCGRGATQGRSDECGVAPVRRVFPEYQKLAQKFDNRCFGIVHPMTILRGDDIFGPAFVSFERLISGLYP